MLNLFEISVNLIEQLIILLFLSFYFGCKYNDIRKYIGFIATVTISTITVTIFNSFYVFEGFLGLVFILIYTVYAHLFLKGNIYTKIFIAGFITCITYFIALFSILFVSIVYDQNDYMIYNMHISRIVLIIMSKTLLIIACTIMLRFRFNDIGAKRNIVLLIVMPIVVEISIIGIMQVFLKHSELKGELLLASISIMAVNVITYYVFIRINKDIEYEAKIKMMEQKEEYDIRHADELDELYKKICSVRHDIIHHFAVLKGLIDDENIRALKYIDAVTDAQIRSVRDFIKTDNDYFDAIVNTKLAVCERSGIELKADVMNGALNKLNNYEIASLFGNLLDNAMEAAKKASAKEIVLEVSKHGDNVYIFMKNTIAASVLEKNKHLRTTKADKEYHGLGINNITKVVNSYNGVIRYFEESGYFCCEILI